MAVANGVVTNVIITQNFKESGTGRTSPFFTYPYVTYSKSGDSIGNIESYILFKRPQKPTDGNISEAYARSGSIAVVGAKLDSSGKLIPLKENESFYLKNDGTLSPLNSNSSNYVFSDPVRQKLNDKGPNGLYNKSVDGFKSAMVNTGEISSTKANTLYSTILGKGSVAPAPPGTDSNGPIPPTGSDPAVPPGSSSGQNTTNTDPIKIEDLYVSNENPETQKIDFNINGTILEYPQKIKENGQDYIKFQILEIDKRKFKDSNSVLLNNRTFIEKPKGTIYLGIQPRITDTNTVKWDSDPMNVFDMATQAAALNIMTGDGQKIEATGKDYASTFNNDPMMKAALSKMSQLAVGSNNNLFTRLTGAILNPNVELLFQGPNLRDFPFSFSMTARDDDEADKIKRIIRAFKQASAVQVGFKYLFLKSPFVFRIGYYTPEKDNPKNYIIHPSLNRIKVCALTSISVDYTPAGTYMTYDDKKRTMTSYNVQLSFTELEPVYDVDYFGYDNQGGIPLDEIGY